METDSELDVTSLAGADLERETEMALESLSAALEANGLRPCVTTARVLVNAYDRFISLVAKQDKAA